MVMTILKGRSGLSVLDLSEIGKYIRKIRKEKGLRLEDLADEQISTATISNIERGVPHVNKEKVLYLLEKLGIDLREIPELLLKDNENFESVQLKLLAAESLLKIGELEKAYEYLLDISEDSTKDTYHSLISSLRGRYYLQAKEYRKAERELIESNRLFHQEASQLECNLEALNYFYLAQCRDAQNDLNHALHYIDKGLEVYQADREDPDQILYQLMIYRVIYLNKLSRTAEALKRLEEIWEHLPKIRKMELLLTAYRIKADLFRRMKLYQDAIRFAREGIQLAANTMYYDQMFCLWTILGSVYIELSNLTDAETCFSFVLELKDRVSDQAELIDAYCALGNLYLHQGKLDDAKQALTHAIEIGEKFHDAFKLCKALIIMGKLMKTIYQYKEAIPYFEQAVELADAYQYKQKKFLAYYELANCYEATGDHEKFFSCIQNMYRVQREMEEDQDLLEI
jgi:tetratricopeptide (TPR) repeat protein